jgi:hypothetical protein
MSNQNAIDIINATLDDDKNIGTENYSGLAYFWDHEYKHYLRDASRRIKKRIHDEFISNGLCVSDVSDEHFKIIMKYCDP